MTQYTKKRLLLAKRETTYGTDPTPTASANAILLTGNPTITPLDGNYATLDYLRPYYGNSPKVPVDAHVKLSFETYLFGSGAAGTAPAIGTLLRGCGFSEAITPGTKVDYARQSGSFDSLTQYFYIDGVMHKLTGAMGTVAFSFKSGEMPKAKWDFTGLFNAVTDTTLPTPTFTGWNTPQPVGKANTSGLTLFGVSNPVLSDFQVDMKNNVIYETLVGLEDVNITDSLPEGSIQIRSNLMAVKNWFDTVKTAATGSLAFTHGNGAGNQIVVTCASANLNNPQYTDLNGAQMLQFGFVPLPTNGNDELVLTFQ